MIDIGKIPSHVLGAIRQNYGAFDGSDKSYDSNIQSLTPEEAFECYCEWHGLLDWVAILIKTLDSLFKAAATDSFVSFGDCAAVCAEQEDQP